jgi:hypothetical protein
MSDGTLVCSWCGHHQPVLGRRPDVRGAEIAVFTDSGGGVYVGVDFADGTHIRHDCPRIPPAIATQAARDTA